ncbi:MAG: hypothetical protein GX847_10905, partial [Clostridiales bacterium]|nr:hypothetical protein [Clostridiales bacterium]
TRNHPEITLINKDGVKDISGYSFDNNPVLLGSAGAHLVKTGCAADMFNDESFFGFYGIRKLMHLINRACRANNGANRKD